MNKLTSQNNIPIHSHQNRGIYSKISLELRTQLIQMVTKKGLTIYRASKILSINNSTAKVIVRNFRKRGHVYCRKSERNKERSIADQGVRSVNSEQKDESRALQASSLAYPIQTHPLISPELDVPFHFCMNPCFPVYYFTPSNAFSFS